MDDRQFILSLLNSSCPVTSAQALAIVKFLGWC